MSFFKKLESFMDGDKKAKKKDESDNSYGHESDGHENIRAIGDHGYGAPTHSYPPPQPNYHGGHQQAQYGQQPPYYQQPPIQHDPHSSPGPQYGYGASPPVHYNPPPFPPPQLPHGWVKNFDENYKTHYYVNTATGVSQWPFPVDHAAHGDSSRALGAHDPYAAHGSHSGEAHGFYGGAHGHDSHGHDSHGHDSHGHGSHGHDSHGHGSHASDSHGYDSHRGHDSHGHDEHKKDKDSDNGKMLAAGVAGLAVGGIAGAVIVHEMTEDDNPETTVIVVQSDEAVVVEQEPEPEPEPEESGSSSEDEEEEAEEDD